MGIVRKIHNLFHPQRGEVWMLHRVVEQRSEVPSQRVLEVTPEWLEHCIQERQKQGFHFVSIDEVGQGKHWICITLDDGYRDNFTVALPLFKRLQVPFCVYVTAGFIDNKQLMWWYPVQQLALNTDELRMLAEEPLCTIGAHTVNHPHLDELPEEAQRFEIETSKRRLETLLGKPVNHFSYPHGAYNNSTVEICRSLGFHTAVTTNGRTVRTNSDPMRLDRINVTQPIESHNENKA